MNRGLLQISMLRERIFSSRTRIEPARTLSPHKKIFSDFSKPYPRRQNKIAMIQRMLARRDLAARPNHQADAPRQLDLSQPQPRHDEHLVQSLVRPVWPPGVVHLHLRPENFAQVILRR